MIYIVAMLTAKPGKRDDLLAVFKDNATVVRLGHGCVQYEPVIDIEGGPEMLERIGDDSFIVLEQWESRIDAEAHAASPNMALYAERAKELLFKRIIFALRSA